MSRKTPNWPRRAETVRIRLSSSRLELLAFVVLALIMVGAGLGWRQPMNVDEERFLGVALEMLQNGSWFIPHRAGEIYADKPPLFMWTVALFVQLTHLPKVALYLPALLAGAVTTACLYDLGRRLWGRRVGVIAALLFLATYQTYSILRTGQIDGFLALWTILGIYGLCRHMLLGPAWRWYYVACAAMGLGIISKGVGFLPVLLLIPYAYALRKGWKGVVAMPGQAGRWWLGLLVALVAIALWLGPLLMIVSQGSADSLAYAQEILFKQTAGRYANAWEHREPFWYFFVQVIPKYWLPIVFMLPWLVPAWRKQLLKHDGRVLVLLGWVLLVLVFFSLSSGKRKLYIFPVLPALILVVAPLVPWMLRRWFGARPRGGMVFNVLAALWLCAWLVRGFVEPHKEGINPHQTLMRDVAGMTSNAELVLVGWREGHWLFARQSIVHFGFYKGNALEQSATWLRSHPRAFALVPARDLARCYDPQKARRVGDTSRAEWFLVGADADNQRCQSPAPEKVYSFTWAHPL
ncbi:Dolichyl-phosphate-mannose-protein mannosyltransferase [Pseudomonas sp. NFACC23-1]|nr:Dolichyl-phosphate-mannose-protein mannosyltransferase [Pseudomonas sp. NFACC17-2]SEJ56430.1 Dolichyl-phosphate-mannose-protein mannosyltransferase [Pseudomonas sp. NFACC23-1]SFW73412.1 Dolichyl-phosphate-mannose-protein mannosyltransferase [Pseudomonas sp. NFACC16-2]